MNAAYILINKLEAEKEGERWRYKREEREREQSKEETERVREKERKSISFLNTEVNPSDATPTVSHTSQSFGSDQAFKYIS